MLLGHCELLTLKTRIIIKNSDLIEFPKLLLFLEIHQYHHCNSFTMEST